MARPGLGLAAAAAIVAAVARGDWPPGSICQLQGVDRSRTSSLRCLTCHDGSVARGMTFIGTTGAGVSHPVEIEYARAYAAHPDAYAPGAAIPREVPLVGGKVACTSCHDGASTEPKHVVRTRDLCLACHRT